jgi:hypothetical protein
MIDDREQNVEAARALGLRALRFVDAERLERDLAALGVRLGDAVGGEAAGAAGPQPAP